MADMTQIDKIISEVNSLEEKEKILFFHKVEDLYNSQNDNQGNDIPIESVFGLWKNRNITKETLRKKAWQKN